MIAMPNLRLVLHKEILKQHFEKNKTSINHLIQIINSWAKNCPVGRNDLTHHHQTGPVVPIGKTESQFTAKMLVFFFLFAFLHPRHGWVNLRMEMGLAIFFLFF